MDIYSHDNFPLQLRKTIKQYCNNNDTDYCTFKEFLLTLLHSHKEQLRNEKQKLLYKYNRIPNGYKRTIPKICRYHIKKKVFRIVKEILVKSYLIIVL